MHTIAIVGRPNVGKSTLFNMLIGKRLAITHEQAGVTRDIKSVKKEYEGVEFEFLDTGGITDEGVFADKISELSYSAFKQADIVLLIVSAEETTAEDEQLIAYTREKNIPVLLVVNKVDNESREWDSAEYYRYGMGEPVMVSALHKRNIEYLWEKIFERLEIQETDVKMETESDDEAFTWKEETDQDEFDASTDISTDANLEEFASKEVVVPERIRLLIMGKPNTGKSSLLNAFLGKERAMVSDIPGTTRDIIEEEVEVFNQKFALIDSAGIRKKNRIYDDVEYYSSHRAISAIDECSVVLLLIDVMEGMSEQDKKLASLIIRKGKGILIGLNKWDLIEIKENRLNAEKDRLSYLVPQLKYAPICPLSAKNKKGLSSLVDEVKKVHTQLFIKINTSLLNRDVQKWVDSNPPPIVRRRRGKLKFIAQSSTNPIIFQARVNNPSFFSDSYKQYLINKIRDKYNINNVPLQLDLILN